MASPVFWAPDFTVNANVATQAYAQDSSQVTALKNGSFMVTWAEFPTHANPYDRTHLTVKGRIYSADGTPRGDEFTVAQKSDAPSVAVLKDGRVAVAFATLSASSRDQIQVTIYNPDGSASGTSFKVNGADGYFNSPEITALADGGFVVSYNSDTGVRYQVYNSRLERSGAEYTLPKPASYYYSDALSVTAFQDGSFAILFDMIGDGVADGFGYRLQPNVAPPDAPNISLPKGTTGIRYNAPRIDLTADGRQLTTWSEMDAHGNGVIKARIGEAGQEFVVAVNPNTGFFSSGRYPLPYDVVTLKDGGFAVARANVVGTDPADTDILVSVFSSTGQKLGDEIRVNTATASTQIEPALSELADGRLVVSWSDGLVRYVSEYSVENSEIRARIIDPRAKAVSVVGTSQNDHYIGTSFNDTLDGGAGIDVLIGGLGNDVFHVDDVGDKVVEEARGGTDTIYASISLALGPALEIERLTATPGTAGLTLKGNALANTITGNAGANQLYGGAGNDQLRGGSGKDKFVFDTKTNKRTNVDKVLDFKSSDDTFYLDNKIFTKLGSGTASKPKKFNSDMFEKGKTAQDREDRIIYDKDTGALYYDPDGTGAKAQVKIATISNKTKLSYHDFYVI